MDTKKNVRGELSNLLIDESIIYPLERLTTVRATCNELRMLLNRRYKTKCDTTERTITVTRIE